MQTKTTGMYSRLTAAIGGTPKRSFHFQQLCKAIQEWEDQYPQASFNVWDVNVLIPAKHRQPTSGTCDRLRVLAAYGILRKMDEPGKLNTFQVVQ